MTRPTIVLLLSLVPATGAAEGGHPRAPLRGSYIHIGPRTAEEPAPRRGPQHRILFVNRHGGTYSPGNVEDSSENLSTIAGEVSRIPPFHGSDANWGEVMNCLREIYSPFAITVTDVEPAPGTTYVESVVGGRWEDLRGVGPAGGVSPFRCETIERGINYTFSADYGDDWRSICETVAQESGHTFGMEHEMLCDDPMTYLPACGLRAFQDVDAPCGEFENRLCSCGSATQNSHRHLMDVLGPSDDIPPQVALTEPREGQTVVAGFVIKAEAMDETRVDRVEYFVDGELVAADDRPLFEVEAPIDLGSGEHTVEAVAVDGDENRMGQLIRVNIAPACAQSSDCGDGRVCEGDRCLADLGTGCEDHSECASEQCYFDGRLEAGYCTVTCTSNDVCPDGFACLEPEFGGTRCMPKAQGGGCGVARRGAAVAVWLLLAAALFAAGTLRRRRA